MPKLDFEYAGYLTPDKITPEIAAAANDLCRIAQKVLY